MPEREAKIRYDLVVDFEEWLARCLTKGATNYGPRSYQRMDPDAVRDCINHAIEHVRLGVNGDTSEPHFVHAAVNLLIVEWHRQFRPDSIRALRESGDWPA